jgi:hypothetical protein
MPEILDFDDLRRVSRLGPRSRLSRVERWARVNGIRYKYDGKGGIWTTQDAMNAAVGITPLPAGQDVMAGEITADMI